LDAAFWALLAPRLLSGLLYFSFGNFRGSKPGEPWFIGLLHRTLRMYTAQ
jgi:hypothetical protein